MDVESEEAELRETMERWLLGAGIWGNGEIMVKEYTFPVTRLVNSGIILVLWPIIMCLVAKWLTGYPSGGAFLCIKS